MAGCSPAPTGTWAVLDILACPWKSPPHDQGHPDLALSAFPWTPLADRLSANADGRYRSLRVPQGSDPTNNDMEAIAPNSYKDTEMKILLAFVLLSPVLSACVSSSSPPPPKTTTVIVPQDSKTVVVCSDGTKPPCN